MGLKTVNDLGDEFVLIQDEEGVKFYNERHDEDFDFYFIKFNQFNEVELMFGSYGVLLNSKIYDVTYE